MSMIYAYLEKMKEEDFVSLQNSECMPTILPSCSFFLGIPYGPAKKMIERGLPIALATDYNPGSSPSGNMNLISSLGCTQMKMTPEQVINATTINTAYAMGVEKELGSVCVGKKANLFITKEIPSFCKASASSPPRPKTKGSPPLRRTTILPILAWSIRIWFISSLCLGFCPILFPANTISAF